MRIPVALLVAVAFATGTADAAAPVRGVALCWEFDVAGTDAAERLEGTAGPEHMAGFGGDDEILAYAGDDCVSSGHGRDVLHLGPGADHADAGSGPDEVHGGPGDDILLPGIGIDRVEGGEGDDLIRDERGDDLPDVLDAGPGHDVVRSVDASADTVLCGPGYDVAIVDPSDTVSDCERVEVARRPRLTARTLFVALRPSFVISWTRGDLPAPARIVVRLVASPGRGAGCRVARWRADGVAPVRLTWRGRVAACSGEYVFALVHLGTRGGGPRVACERLESAPPHGCPPTERLGRIAVRVP